MEFEINLVWFLIEKYLFYIKYCLNIYFIFFYDKVLIKEL